MDSWGKRKDGQSYKKESKVNDVSVGFPQEIVSGVEQKELSDADIKKIMAKVEEIKNLQNEEQYIPQEKKNRAGNIMSVKEARIATYQNKELDKDDLWYFFNNQWKYLSESEKRTLANTIYKRGSKESDLIVKGNWRDIGQYNMKELMNAFKAKGWVVDFDPEENRIKRIEDEYHRKQKYPRDILEEEKWRKQGRFIPSRKFWNGMESK